MKNSLKRTLKNEKAVVRAYLNTGDLTSFCRAMKAWGVVRRIDIMMLMHKHYTSSYCKRTKVLHVAADNRKYMFEADSLFALLQSDLDNKPETYVGYEGYTFIQWLKSNKVSGNYMKVLIVGNKHIYWASPVYQHSDYNKSIWRDNTAENRRKAEIINRFLNK